MTPTPPVVRVLLVEDNEVYRSSLELLLGLQSGLAVVGAVGTGTEAAEAAERLRADVVLMDYRLPGLDGVEKKSKLTAKPIHGTNQGAENIPRAPRTLIETTRIFRESKLARDWFGDDFVDHYAATREWEWRQWLDAITDWEMKRYFEII